MAGVSIGQRRTRWPTLGWASWLVRAFQQLGQRQEEGLAGLGQTAVLNLRKASQQQLLAASSYMRRTTNAQQTPRPQPWHELPIALSAAPRTHPLTHSQPSHLCGSMLRGAASAATSARQNTVTAPGRGRMGRV